ncbi:hypothetical protein PGT21_036314 [Puccinia graminis f. sp. tritici]|uniref:Uncharacterized protein n=1 Tax=Puccinia graminis f. sp. tritici TaxID=56615 RepID=A0A5B0NEJ3_PUCGR|nr:hypothetical protein PGT21_036314 [Puccinia graminis f. sp. tritici]
MSLYSVDFEYLLAGSEITKKTKGGEGTSDRRSISNSTATKTAKLLKTAQSEPSERASRLRVEPRGTGLRGPPSSNVEPEPSLRNQTHFQLSTYRSKGQTAALGAQSQKTRIETNRKRRDTRPPSHF